MNAPNDITFKEYLNKTTKKLQSTSRGFIFFNKKVRESFKYIRAGKSP